MFYTHTLTHMYTYIHIYVYVYVYVYVYIHFQFMIFSTSFILLRTLEILQEWRYDAKQYFNKTTC